MCTDPETGEKTFTDKACPTKGTGEKIKVQPKNFGGSGHPTAIETKTWTSDRDQSRAGRDNFTGHAGQVEKARSVNPAPDESEE